MTDSRWNTMDDAELDRLVADGVEALDAPPAHIGAGARAAFELRHLDAQLEQLTLDDAVGVVRDGEDDRADVSFETDHGPGSLSVERVAGGWSVSGVAPGSNAVTVASTGGGTASVDVDDAGFFEHTMPAGVGEAVRVIIGGRLVTPWMP